MNQNHAVMIVVMAALVTMAIRFLPFILFGRSDHLPPVLLYLSRVLPYAIIGMMVVYCLKNVSVFTGSHGVPELISCAAVAGLHFWRKNTLLSILAGTVLYMILIQVVF